MRRTTTCHELDETAEVEESLEPLERHHGIFSPDFEEYTRWCSAATLLVMVLTWCLMISSDYFDTPPDMGITESATVAGYVSFGGTFMMLASAPFFT